jgi:hypothetical protein
MEFQEKSIIDPVADFIKTCPFQNKYNVDLSEIDTGQFSDKDVERFALEYVGSNLDDYRQFITGGAESVRQANFQLWIKRKSNGNDFRKETADFIYNFERWVDYCQHNELTPTIGDDPTAELMWADNGAYAVAWEDGRQASVYMIQLHIQYTKNLGD